MGAERRAQQRWNIDTIEVEDLMTLDNCQLLSSKGVLNEASSSGFLLTVNRKDVIPEHLRTSLTMETLVGKPVGLVIRQMELDINGYIVRTQPVGKGLFQLVVDYTDDAPEYWRECLIDLLPKSAK